MFRRLGFVKWRSDKNNMKQSVILVTYKIFAVHIDYLKG